MAKGQTALFAIVIVAAISFALFWNLDDVKNILSRGTSLIPTDINFLLLVSVLVAIIVVAIYGAYKSQGSSLMRRSE
jgi:hypothetical protein